MAVHEKTPHILNASANLVGLCFLLLTSLKLLNLNETTMIDLIVTLGITLFMASTLICFLAIRSPKSDFSRLEAIADYLFLGGIILLYLTSLLIAFEIID